VGVTNNTVPVIVVLRLVGETIVKEHVLINVLLPNVEDHLETVRLDALRDSTEQIVTTSVLQNVYMAAIKKQNVSHYIALIVKVECRIATQILKNVKQGA
jgi:hypothetical protein